MLPFHADRIAALPEELMLNGLTVLTSAMIRDSRAMGHQPETLPLFAHPKAWIAFRVTFTARKMATDVLYCNPNLLYPSLDADFPLGLNGLYCL